MEVEVETSNNSPLGDGGRAGVIPHLFRTEYRKIVSVLCRRFGLSGIETAEDIASDTFMTAAQDWPLKGVPANPVAWLYHVAKNKAKNYLQRGLLFKNKILPALKQEENVVEEELDLSPQNISDSQLQMMFAICHPAISPEAQIGLSLRILCGFGIDEIAAAFLSKRETIIKRLTRAREKLRQENIAIAMPGSAEIDDRLEAVLTTLYLLFNEGYYSAAADQTIKKELCVEAMRLCHMLLENAATNKPAVNALLSLMCFQASRFDARISRDGELLLYEEQDESLWNEALINTGVYHFHCSAKGDKLSKYHLETAIAYWSTKKEDGEKWENVLQLYNQLLQLHYSPVAALNRTYALSKVKGKPTAIIEAEKLKLTGNRFYFVLLGELYSGVDDAKAIRNFEQAVALCKADAERLLMRKRIDKLNGQLNRKEIYAKSAQQIKSGESG